MTIPGQFCNHSASPNAEIIYKYDREVVKIHIRAEWFAKRRVQPNASSNAQL